jgi:DNA-binding beta-propeller fold protein YncE
MKSSLFACIVLALIGSSVLMCSSSRSNGVSFPPRIAIEPRNAKVFAGDSLQFYTTVVGALTPPSIRWSVVGPGRVDDNGLYRAADVPSSADIVASTGNGLAESVAVRTVMPPSTRQALVLSTCYSDGTVNVNDARNFAFIGALSVGGRTAGITVNERQRLAIFAVESQIVAIDLRNMQWKVSAPIAGIRFSEIAQVGTGYLAATDNNAEPGHLGVRIYRINPLGVPVLVSSVVAGETPEGITPTVDGHGFYVSNINGNSIMRFAIDARGHARMIASQKTATRPFGLALDPVHHVLFVADNDTSVISGAKARPGLERFASTNLRRIGGIISTGSISSLPLGAAVDASIGRLFVTNEGAGNVIVFALPSMRRIAALPTGLTPWLPTLDPESHRLYVPNARANTISVYDTKRLRIVASAIPTCSYPTSIAVANAEGR